MTTTEVLRIVMIVLASAMTVLALHYLRGRGLPRFQAMAWALLALLVPVVGPFLVVVLRPRAAYPEKVLSKS